MIVLELPCVNAKLKNSFKNDSHADVRIVYNDEAVFNLQKAYLRIESAYFKEQLGELGRRQLEIRAGFQVSVGRSRVKTSSGCSAASTGCGTRWHSARP